MLVEDAPAAPPAGTSSSPGEQAEQALLALTLITTWALVTGRTLRSDVPPGELPEDELIEFWADPLMAARGLGSGHRHRHQHEAQTILP